jgi:hypothetical protein
MPMGGMLDDYKKGNNQARISLWDECLIATQMGINQTRIGLVYPSLVIPLFCSNQTFTS